MFCNGKPQPNTAIVACDGIIHLSKRFENIRLCFPRDAYAGILNLDRPVVSDGMQKVDFDAALLGEFDRVTDEVDNNLLQAVLVAAELVRKVPS